MENVEIDLLSIDTNYPYEVSFYVTFDNATYKERYQATSFALRKFQNYLKYKAYGKAYDFIKDWEQILSEKI